MCKSLSGGVLALKRAIVVSTFRTVHTAGLQEKLTRFIVLSFLYYDGKKCIPLIQKFNQSERAWLKSRTKLVSSSLSVKHAAVDLRKYCKRNPRILYPV